MRNGCVISLVKETHVTDVTEASSWFSALGLLTVVAPGTVHSCSHSPFSLVNCCQVFSRLRRVCVFSS